MSNEDVSQTETFQSKFILYSIGQVAVTKSPDSYDCVINLIETNHLFNANLHETEKEVDLISKDRNGVDIPMKSKTSEVITCEWLGLGTGGNRATAPDVVQGEKVVVYRFGDTSQYFWEKIYSQRELRRLERVLYIFGGTSAPGVNNTTDNSYWLLMSTLDSLVRLHTSKENGEPFEWDINLNTKEGFLRITDNSGISHNYDASEATSTLETDKKILNFTDIFRISARRKLIVGGRGGSFKFGENGASLSQGGSSASGASAGAGMRAMSFARFSSGYNYRNFNFSYVTDDERSSVNDRNFTIDNDTNISHVYDTDKGSTELIVENEIYNQSDTIVNKGKTSITDESPLIESKSDRLVRNSITIEFTGEDSVRIIGANEVSIGSNTVINLESGVDINLTSESGINLNATSEVKLKTRRFEVESDETIFRGNVRIHGTTYANVVEI